MKKSVIGLISAVSGAILGFVGRNYLLSKEKYSSTDKVYKFKSYYHLLNRWMQIKNDGNHLADYLESKNYHTVALYGMGELGERLCEELKNSNIKIQYVMDKNLKNLSIDYEVRTLADNLEPVDAIIVTAIFAYDEIEQELSKIVNFPIISLEEIIYDI